jgi:hypothetical protein
MPRVVGPTPLQGPGGARTLSLSQPDHCEVDPCRGHRESKGATGQEQQQEGRALGSEMLNRAWADPHSHTMSTGDRWPMYLS